MRAIGLGLLAVLCGCGSIEDAEVAAADRSLLQSDDPQLNWIRHPQFLDESQHGTTNCSPHVASDPTKFNFGMNTGCGVEAQHEFSACFERQTGYDGWIRQHSHALHCDSTPACGGGPGDLYVVRLCRAGEGPPGTWQGQESPGCGTTGPFGCVPCFYPMGSPAICH
jgi:hypothetical protein